MIGTPSSRTQQCLSNPVRIEIGTDLRVLSGAGVDILLKSRRARALLALIATSPTSSISRQRVAAILWSSSGRISGLARLRDVLHHLRKDFDEAGVDILDLQGDAILFRSGAVQIGVEFPLAEAATISDRHSKFLISLEGIDPALDRWLAHVRAERGRPEILCESLEGAFKTGSRAKRGPSVVVIEFEGPEAPADARLAKALTDEVGGALARMRWFTTITRNNQGVRFPVGSEDFSKIADYGMIGVVQSDNTRYRLLLKLMDFNDGGTIVWASIFEEERQQPTLAIQKQFANAVAACLDTELLLVEVERRRGLAVSRQKDAYSLVMQAVPGIYRLEQKQFFGAGHLLAEAVALDPESALAHGWLAYWNIFLVGQNWAENPFRSMGQGGRAADRAMLLDPKDARAATIAGHVKAFLNRQLSEAMVLHEMALQLNPALALAWHFSGMTHAYSGRLDDAYRCIHHCRQLAPTDPLGFYAEGALGIVHLLRHDHEAAVSLGRRVTERHPTFTSTLKSYLAALGHLGRKSEAGIVLQRLKLLEPRFSLHSFHTTAPYQRPEDLQHFVAGLRLAGVI